MQNYSSQSASSALNRILICKSQKLYFRTTLGLLQVSSIDFKTKTFTVSHHSCSSALKFISPTLLSSGFPSPPQPNSLVLLNCVNWREPAFPVLRNCTSLYSCEALSKRRGKQSSCLVVHDTEKLERSFSPRHVNCSHYKRVYMDSGEGFHLGTVISYDIPDHMPNICAECVKPQGNCGVGLRCICHPKECRDKVVSSAGVTRSHLCNITPILLVFIIMYILGF